MKFFSSELFKQDTLKNAFASQLSQKIFNTSTSIFFLSVLLLEFLFTGCKKHGTNECKGLDKYKEFASSVKGLSPTTVCELQQAREATSRYQDIRNAKDDGYEDISVVLPNMGHHFMKTPLVDAKFEISRPEILVYNKNDNDVFELVAVEYAVPIPLTPLKQPGGFTGTADVWDRNAGFDLWLLHAWVWKPNSAGVFNPTNPGVHVH